MNTVTSRDGIRGRINLSAYPLDGSQEKVPVEMENGQEVLIPWDLFQPEEGGNYSLPVDLSEYIQSGEGISTTVIPVIEEQLDVHKRTIETGKVRITRRVHEHEETVDEPLFQEYARVERIPINQQLDVPASIRREGDTLVIPVMEEVLVVEKRLILKEEIRITQSREQVRNPQTVNLKSEEVIFERLEADQPGEENTGSSPDPVE